MSLIYPAAGTTLLAGICEKNGFTTKVVDLNYELYQQVGQETYDDLASYLSLSGDIDPELHDTYHSFVDTSAKKLIQQHPNYIGISVFTFECQKFCQDLCQSLYKQNFSGNIILGGAGLSTTGIANRRADFGEFLVSKNLVQGYIRGEADAVILDILRRGLSALDDFNVIKEMPDINDLNIPRYDDLIGNQYIWPGGVPTLPITGSRGCVRACTFCDIHKFWPKFRFRRGASVAQEMLDLKERTDINNFVFTDSLINGSIQSFREMCNFLIQYYRNNNLPDRWVKWGGQFICRPSTQFKDIDFERAARAGMTGVAIGVESGSDTIRQHMKKQFTNHDLDFTMQCLSRYRINCYFLIIVGYPTETWEDFMDTVKMFERYQHYSEDGTIMGINLGGTLSLDAGTDLIERAAEIGLHDGSGSDSDVWGINWINKNNPDLTLEERISRRILLQERLMDLGYNIWNGDHQLKRLMRSYDRIKNGIY